jgi:predicted nucleic acid-binding protein
VTWVVDASVAVKWVVPEILSAQADRLLGSEDPLIAPDLLMIESANAFWKKIRRKELSATEAGRALDVLSASGIVVYATQPLLGRALAMARHLEHPVYDCVYVALAERERATLVTADERLLARLGRRRMKARVVDLRCF